MYIDDCLQGIDMITHCEKLIATPINLGSDRLISITDLLTMVEQIGQTKLERHHDMDAPKGVGGRNSDNTFIEKTLNWKPSISLEDGMKKTYQWIEKQYFDRKAGKHTVS